MFSAKCSQQNEPQLKKGSVEKKRGARESHSEKPHQRVTNAVVLFYNMLAGS